MCVYVRVCVLTVTIPESIGVVVTVLSCQSRFLLYLVTSPVGNSYLGGCIFHTCHNVTRLSGTEAAAASRRGSSAAGRDQRTRASLQNKPPHLNAGRLFKTLWHFLKNR